MRRSAVFGFRGSICRRSGGCPIKCSIHFRRCRVRIAYRIPAVCRSVSHTSSSQNSRLFLFLRCRRSLVFGVCGSICRRSGGYPISCRIHCRRCRVLIIVGAGFGSSGRYPSNFPFSLVCLSAMLAIANARPPRARSIISSTTAKSIMVAFTVSQYPFLLLSWFRDFLFWPGLSGSKK